MPHDYEFSPRHFDDEDDHLSSAVSTNSDSSVQQMPMADIKMEPQDMDYMDAVEQEQAILGKKHKFNLVETVKVIVRMNEWMSVSILPRFTQFKT